MDQRDLRGIQTYPTWDVILLCVLFMIIMRFYHADSTPLRIKALDFFLWMTMTGCTWVCYRGVFLKLLSLDSASASFSTHDHGIRGSGSAEP